jgi:hypothetical protein
MGEIRYAAVWPADDNVADREHMTCWSGNGPNGELGRRDWDRLGDRRLAWARTRLTILVLVGIFATDDFATNSDADSK